MLQKNISSFKRVILTALLIFVRLWGHCDAQVNKAAADLPDEHGGAFSALQSCHQLLQDDSGEFFSPDYLCSNPPLWCNWTIKVEPGKRIHLHLEDLTPDETCHLKRDQIHVDEPAGPLLGHKVLQKCWREAKFTSSSNILHVVLLIGGWPTPPYRGFCSRYQAFGPLVVYIPQESFTEPSRTSAMSPALSREYEADTSSDEREPERSDTVYDHYDQHLAMTSELPWELDGEQQRDSKHYELKPSTLTPAAAPGKVEEGVGAVSESWIHSWSTSTSITGTEKAEGGENRMKVSQVTNQLPPPSEEPLRQSTEPTHPHPHMVEPLANHRGSLTLRNQSEPSHLPGDHLFEVSVEVDLNQDLEEPLHVLAGPLLQSVKVLISKQLGALHMLLSLSSKRIIRLHAGALYILWLQIGQRPAGGQFREAVHSAVRGLVLTGGGTRKILRNAAIISVTVADVNECGTELVLCDINAHCTNQFGSYSCECGPGFQDQSRLGSGGTLCMEVMAAGGSSGLSSETKGVYALFFLLSSLILMLLAVAGVVYHRHHRGAFLVRCHSSGSISPHDCNNHHQRTNEGFSCPPDSDLLPPPPPARGYRGGWPPVKERPSALDLPLLRFSPLLPPDSYTDPQDGGKM